jgi:hypothetical protein
MFFENPVCETDVKYTKKPDRDDFNEQLQQASLIDYTAQ